MVAKNKSKLKMALVAERQTDFKALNLKKKEKLSRKVKATKVGKAAEGEDEVEDEEWEDEDEDGGEEEGSGEEGGINGMKVYLLLTWTVNSTNNSNSV